MAKSPPPPSGDDEKKIADADWLMRETPKSKPKPVTPGTSRPHPEADHSYDLAEGHDEPADTVAPPPPVFPDPLAPPAPRRPKPKKADAEEAAPAGPPATVDQVWSRGAEWGFQLFLMAIAAVGIGFAVYLAVAATQFFIAFILLACGAAVLLVLCYPIFITLERPVRITPEQGAKDYYAMLSHVFPHYRRMWLLLSSAGRSAPEFSSYGQFKSYWKKRLADLQGGRAPTLNPLNFQVEDFRSEKSAGMTALNAKYTVKVFRGEPTPANEVASVLISTSLVKGPDRMWYLNSGTLPYEKK